MIRTKYLEVRLLNLLALFVCSIYLNFEFIQMNLNCDLQLISVF